MPNFDTGVSRYVIGRATVTQHFPVDHKGNEDVNCEQCRFYNQRSRRCNLNDCLCPYPSRCIAPDCPLDFIE